MEENVPGCYAQKPLKAIQRILQTSSKEDDLIVDYFSHSGTVLIAGEFTLLTLTLSSRKLRYVAWSITEKQAKLAGSGIILFRKSNRIYRIYRNNLQS